MDLEFEWDAAKAAENARKHGVTFDEASTAFADPLSSVFADPDHSLTEERLVIVGRSDRDRVQVADGIAQHRATMAVVRPTADALVTRRAVGCAEVPVLWILGPLLGGEKGTFPDACTNRGMLGIRRGAR